MKERIAVEDKLSEVSQELKTFGYEVVDLDNTNLADVNAVVISGMDKNTMDMSTIQTNAPIINALGMTAVQIRNEIDKRKIKN
ncbi:MAG: YkuS family protein [Firmicutes bacterium]|nr:YkuS family protein [Bacillota bacterium]